MTPSYQQEGNAQRVLHPDELAPRLSTWAELDPFPHRWDVAALLPTAPFVGFRRWSEPSTTGVLVR